MKKFLAYAGSAMFCPLVFLILVEINLRFIYLEMGSLYYVAFPLLMIFYFLIAGRVFRPLGIRRWPLWLVMNLIGYPLCWAWLTIRVPGIWFNLGIVLFFIPITIALVVAWLAVGAVFLLLRLIRTPPAGIKGTARSLLRRIVNVMKPLLLTLAVVGVASAGYRFMTMRPAGDYADEGVYTFVASQGYPTVEGASTYRSGSSYRSRQRSVYKVVYQAQGAGYTYTQEAPAESIGKQYVREKRAVDRRVLSIVGEGSYITVDADYTLEGYVQSLRRRYLLVFGVSAGYLTALAVRHIWRKRTEEERAAYG